MIDLSRMRNYYVACGYTDLRRGIDGLAEIVMRQYGTELDEDSLFLFCGRRTDRLKALYFSTAFEKRAYVMAEGEQVQLFNEAEAVQDVKAPEPTVEEVTVAAHKRKKKRSLEELAESLPVEEIVLELSEDQLKCEKCGGTFRLIGKKLVKSEMIYIPASVKLLKYYACTYACDRCEKETGYAHIVGTTAPPSLMKHSLASPSSVADRL